ncbi:MAG: hypothetical protein ACRDNJ_04440 [Solirubrobacteraceae bacterium]
MAASSRRRIALGSAAALASAVVLVGAAVALAAPASRAHRADRVVARAARLRYSQASNRVVQRQPPAGSCHARGRGLYKLPDRRCTPGALNRAVSQATIGATICRSGWTSTVRPPESVTEAEKRASMRAYGDHKPMGDYEYDHLVPLELGGATNDRRNLWPEPGASPNPKDSLENRLRAAVCEGNLALAVAQREIAANWVALARRGAPGGSTSPGAGAASCSATAAWSDRYHDFDIYVRSNQPDREVTVAGPGGLSAGWHTDSSGYADVYLHAPMSAAGDRVTVRAGAATCSANL